MSDMDPTPDPTPDDAGTTPDATAGDQPQEVRVSPTELTQIELILRSVPEVGAFPGTWRDSPGGVQYLYREGSILVRDWHLDRVQEAMQEMLPDDRHRRTDVVAGATRLTWDSRDERASVQEVLRFVEERVGEKVAAPDHLVYVCGHSCAAIEPEEVPAGSDPYPRPRVGQDAAGPWCRHGAGVKVLVMDTGLVEDAATDHWWMEDVTGEPDEPYLPGGGLALAQDGGHGTFVAGCVRVTAPEADVHVVNATRLLPREPESSPIGAVFESDLARLVRSQLVAGPGEPPKQVPDILVLNFAGTTEGGGPLLAFDALYDDLIQHLKELLILAPAGNEGDTRKNWPGSFAWVVSVGGLDTTWRERATWSNHGHNVDVFAPGDRLVNAFAKGTYTPTWEPTTSQPRSFDGMALWSGTSFATPLVAGLVAARMSTTGQSSRRAWHSLLELAEHQAVPGVGPVLYPGQGCGAPCGPW